LRIVLLNQYYAPDESASSQLLTDLGAGLVAAGHAVTAICGNRGYADPALRYPARQSISGVEVIRVRTTGFGRSSRLGRLIDYLTFMNGAWWKLLFHRRPDIFISLSTPPMIAALGLMLARVRRAQSVCWVMDVYPELAFEIGALDAGSLAGRSLAFLTRLTLRRSDAVVAIGETMEERLRAAGAGRLVTIHNWADGEAIRSGAERAEARRKEMGWEGRFVLLYSGNLGLAHEFDTILDAAEMLRGHPAVSFAFIGGGPCMDEIQRAVRQRSLSNVSIRPYVERRLLGESLTSGDVHLITLRPAMPGLLVPCKLYGVLAAGRPTIYIGPAAGEVFDIITDAQCGVRIPNGDPEALVQAILHYERDEEARKRAGWRARRLFEDRFTMSHGLGAFVRLLESLRAG
jgi:glycosyltransferase involved in cell wall biosynthesis